MKQFIDKLKNLESWHIYCIFAGVGLLTFFTGLRNPFQGDDALQIVNNTPVHSLGNLFYFFQHSTFFDGNSLVGIYYRPLMTTTFSIIYSIFHTNTFGYHFVQLALYISSAFIFYLILKHFLKKQVLALALALIFLVHPLNSQVVFSIPTMQDALFFFFGSLALWLLITYKSTRSLFAVVGCLFLSLLSKESAIVFVAITSFYILLFDRKRILKFGAILVPVFAVYVAMKLNAVGFSQAQHAGPINDLSLGQRLMTTPSIIWFFITKFLFPWKLALNYFWVNKTFSVQHVLLPALGDLLFLGVLIYGGWRVRKKLPKKFFLTYLFFGVWMLIGMLPYMQIIALDMTACETWFYFSMAGLLGLIGTFLLSIKSKRINTDWLVIAAAVLIAILGLRTAIRGTDYKSQYNLALQDLKVSAYNYSALNNVAQEKLHQGKYKEAASYAQRSIDQYPTATNYINLGAALQRDGDLDGAEKAYLMAKQESGLSMIYENLALIYLVKNDSPAAKPFFEEVTKKYPTNFKLWLYYAIFEGSHGRHESAQAAIEKAAKYGQVPPLIYNSILIGQPITIPILGKNVQVK